METHELATWKITLTSCAFISSVGEIWLKLYQNIYPFQCTANIFMPFQVYFVQTTISKHRAWPMAIGDYFLWKSSCTWKVFTIMIAIINVVIFFIILAGIVWAVDKYEWVIISLNTSANSPSVGSTTAINYYTFDACTGARACYMAFEQLKQRAKQKASVPCALHCSLWLLFCQILECMFSSKDPFDQSQWSGE